MPPTAYTINLEKPLAMAPITSRCSANAPQISCTSSSNLAILCGIVLAAAGGGEGACTGAETHPHLQQEHPERL
ncbi:hypothetical protein Tco_1121629 [Tanacetum coccineum]|uniref:Uncharacterized protein n=1 Tax=Tanacetum coccineum TaxID=301880 RepID=A0ABQ5IY83_9ASTR